MTEVADIVSEWKAFALVLGVKKPSLEEIERKCPGMLMYVHKRAQQLSSVCVCVCVCVLCHIIILIIEHIYL